LYGKLPQNTIEAYNFLVDWVKTGDIFYFVNWFILYYFS